MTKKTKIGLIQLKISKNLDKNINNAISKIKVASKRGAKIVCVPELFLSQYFCQSEKHHNFKLAEKIPSETTKIFSKTAKQFAVILILSLFEKKISGMYHNTIIIINEKGKIINKYRKMHIPDDPGYYEKFYFTPGDIGFQSIKTKYCNIGSLICWDQWFPEAARITTLKGADIIFYPTAIGWHPKEKKKFGKDQLDSWITIQRSHSIANGVYIAAINRVGVERKGKARIEFWGNSFISDPSGKVISKLGSKKEGVIIAEIDLKKVESTRQHWPFLRDRRIDAYKSILKNPKDE